MKRNTILKKLKCKTDGCRDVKEVGTDVTARTCHKCVTVSMRGYIAPELETKTNQ